MTDSGAAFPGNLKALSNRKPTESIQARFTEREFEILNQAYRYHHEHRSRHSLLKDTIMKMAYETLAGQDIYIDPGTNLPSDSNDN